MLKTFLALAVVVGIILAASHFMQQHHVNGPVPGPVNVQVSVPNPLGGGQPSSGDKIYVP